MKHLLLTAVLVASTGAATAEYLPLPPRFTVGADAETVLRTYPLGVITKLAAHSFHGHPDHKLTLPNGQEGWVYEVYGDRHTQTYIQPDGTKRSVNEIEDPSPRWEYTLVFDSNEKVVDVLYDSKHPRLGLSALQVQRRIDPVGQKLPDVDHGAHFPPGVSLDRY